MERKRKRSDGAPAAKPKRARSSVYRGVTRHRWTGRYEAHLWDKDCWSHESQKKKGRQVYLGAYDDEEAAAHAYDLAALKYWGRHTTLNFPVSSYEEELKEMESQSREEYIGSLRRKSSGFSRGVSKYRGVAREAMDWVHVGMVEKGEARVAIARDGGQRLAWLLNVDHDRICLLTVVVNVGIVRHHHNGRWEARIGRVFGNKYLYLGTYATQEEAATAYDMAAIEYRGINAVTNFDLSRYIKWLRPSNTQGNDKVQHPDAEPPSDETPAPEAPPKAGGGGASALGILFQSSKFKEMLERSTATDCPVPASPESQPPGRIFPDDIQTCFDVGQDSESYIVEGDDHDFLFSDINSLAATTTFQCELLSFDA